MNCDIFNDNLTCGVCKPGYSKNSNNQCMHDCNNRNCLTCNSDGTCTKCSPGYNLSGQVSLNFCARSITNCSHYNSDYSCLKCADGFKVSISGNCVKKCSDRNCQFCDQNDSCNTCNINFEFYKLQNAQGNYYFICVPSNINCLNFNSDLTCNKCVYTYTLNTSGACVKSCLDPNCQNCVSYGVCSFCNNGYFVSADNSICTLIKTNCAKADANLFCEICDTGFQLTPFEKCQIICSNNCQSCDDNGSCLKCNSNYLLHRQNDLYICVQPNQNCDIFNNDSTCEICSNGYSLDNSSSCSLCKNNQYLINNECNLCGDLCNKCSANGCVSCISNAQTKDFTCECNDTTIYLSGKCMSIGVIIDPLIVLIFLIIVTTIIMIFIKRRKARILQAANLESGRVLQIVNLNRAANDNSYRIDIQAEFNQEFPLKPLSHLPAQNSDHNSKCVYGDNNPPFWKLNCGGFVCNNCSTKVLTSISNCELEPCPTCSNKMEFFNFINRLNRSENNLRVDTNTSIQVGIYKYNAALGDDDKKCNICFYLPESKKIQCESEIPHMLCTYCYKRLVLIEKIKLCPFCRTGIK